MSATKSLFSARRSPLALLAIFALALAIRLVHLHVAGNAGLLDGLFLDSKYYAQEAAAIRAGVGSGAHPYLLSPLYPYVLALFTGASGELDVGSLRVLQAFAGAATAVLAALIAQRLGGRTALWIAGLVAAFYGPSIHVQALVLVSCLQGLFLTLGLALIVVAEHDPLATRDGATPGVRVGHTPAIRTGAAPAVRERDRRRAASEQSAKLAVVPDRRAPWLYLCAGLAFGVSAALHPTGLAVALAIAIAMLVVAWWRERALGALKPAAMRAAAIIAGTLLTIAPFTLHNLRTSGEPVLLSANGGFNFFIGNNADASGIFRAPEGYDFVNDPVGRQLAESRSGAQLSYRGASSWWSARALDDVRAHPLSWLALLGKKLLLFFHPREIPQLGENFDWFKNATWPLGLPLDARVLFLLALCAPLSALLREDRRLLAAASPLLVASSVYALVIALFFVTARYREPVMPTVIALAAIGATGMYDMLVRRAWNARARVLGAVGLVAALAFASIRLYDKDDAPLRLPDPTGVEERHAGMNLSARGRFDEAIAAYESSLALRDDPATRTNLANALKAAGRIDEAAAQYRLVLVSHPRDGIAWYNYGNLLRKQIGDLRSARDAYVNAIEFQPLLAEAHFNLGAVLLDLGLPLDATAEIESALSLAPFNASWRKEAEEALVLAHMRSLPPETAPTQQLKQD